MPTVTRPAMPFTIVPEVIPGPMFAIHFHLPLDATLEYVEQFFKIATKYASGRNIMGGLFGAAAD